MPKLTIVTEESTRSANATLKAASKREWEDVLVMGYNPEGRIQFECSPLTNAEVLFLIEQFKKQLLEGDYRPS